MFVFCAVNTQHFVVACSCSTIDFLMFIMIAVRGVYPPEAMEQTPVKKSDDLFCPRVSGFSLLSSLACFTLTLPSLRLTLIDEFDGGPGV
jgi:hypothetical protein